MEILKGNEELMREYGSRVVVKGNRSIMPIRHAGDLEGILFQSTKQDQKIRSYIRSVHPMDDGWKRRVRESFWWGREEREAGIDPRLYELRERLLSFGGEAVCFSFGEPDIEGILSYGQLWHGYGAEKRRGQMCRCHENAASLFSQYGYRVCTGYALSDDGMWRQHSWCIEKRPRSTKIIETTESRVLYFGYVLDNEDLRAFLCRLY